MYHGAIVAHVYETSHFTESRQAEISHLKIIASCSYIVTYTYQVRRALFQTSYLGLPILAGRDLVIDLPWNHFAVVMPPNRLSKADICTILEQ